MLNELAQDLRPMSQGIEWFEKLSGDVQAVVLRELVQFCLQARATSEDGPASIRRAAIRPTHTPAVLITRGRIDEQLRKIASLAPQDERVKAFRLLVALLAVADRRRRKRFCANGCSHNWHQLTTSQDTCTT
ncbi:DUF5958 family protein [Streptomyces sviceus]|uniref:DUF5958 family protein n=1 Tax=Streptomyces sviceus TaxID=285530 RepID=UPI0036C08BDB